MRAQRSGTVVDITSMGGKIYTPLGGWYHSTKFTVPAERRVIAVVAFILLISASNMTFRTHAADALA
ncbi:hypothetical protein [Streptomyces sp. NPDC096132]|uniref:hypothetical protein n=1 Tax=Streptomyces sp. NPDC096132 TaxID=3366075 RepID=UPI0038014785